MLLNQELLSTLTAQAKASPRLRQNYDLRNSGNDNSQRILYAKTQGTVLNTLVIPPINLMEMEIKDLVLE